MGRSRCRRSGGGPTRRWFLAGGALIVGGVAIRSGTGAFSRVSAGRLAALDTSDDDSALLGLERTDAVRPGVDEQHLVDLTNNTDERLRLSLAVESRSGTALGHRVRNRQWRDSVGRRLRRPRQSDGGGGATVRDRRVGEIDRDYADASSRDHRSSGSQPTDS